MRILDAMDGDPDEEDSDIREDDAGDAGEMDEDREPSLGWLIQGASGINDGGLDLEDEADPI